MSDMGHELTDKKLKQLEGELKQLYKQASDEVEKKLDNYLKAFKAKDAKHLADLQKDFTKENYEEYIRWRQGQVLISERWEEMRQSLAEDYHHANMAAKSVIEGYMPDIYALNHNYGTYDVEHKGLVDTSYTLYDRQTVERLMRDDPDMLPPPGKKVSKRIAEGKDVLWNKAQIQASMWQSVTQGESMDKIAQRLAQTVGDKDMAAAVRNARTMTTGAECAGRVDSYKRAEDMGIQLQQEWMSTLDGRTRHSHRELHGERIDVDGTFSNGCRFPGDPSGPAEEVYNCRCTLVAAIKGFEGDKVTYSPKMGDMTFEEWQGDKEKKALTNASNNAIINESEAHKKTVEYIEALKIESVPTKTFDSIPSESEIINRLSGGDMTKGSCTSLAFAYAGNKGGIDVLDFRGGDSCDFFATTANILQIANFNGVDATIIRNTNDFKAINELLKGVVSDKEYILVTGKHTAVIRKADNGFEYLNMQNPDSKENVFKPLTTKALKSRFGCQKSYTINRHKLQASSLLFDRESLSNSEEFKDILKYINTDANKQMKGVGGRVR